MLQLGRVDEVELINKEMYSSRVKEFSVRGRQAHPRKDGPPAEWPRWFDADASWQLLGHFTAANRKGAQSFRMHTPRRVRCARPPPLDPPPQHHILCLRSFFLAWRAHLASICRRYLLLQFHTHYGAEEVCALNSIAVLGVSAAQELEEALAAHLHGHSAAASGGLHSHSAQQQWYDE